MLAVEQQVRLRNDAQQLSNAMDADRVNERARRISAETLAVERRAEVERLISELSGVRTELTAVMAERLKSLDSLNVKLMTERTEEKPPDMAQYKKSLEALGTNAVRQMRHIHHSMDAAILTKMHPRFAKVAGAVMNETMETQPAD
jgi:hypothetical protein